MVYVCRSKEIVRDIGLDIFILLRPFHCGVDAFDIAHELLLKLHTGVGVAFDRSLSAVPGPSGVPRCTVAGEAIDVDALRASTLVFSPKVIVDRVWGLWALSYLAHSSWPMAVAARADSPAESFMLEIRLEEAGFNRISKEERID